MKLPWHIKRHQWVGLNKFVSAIANKKQKMGCLDKSKLDWDSYVENEGIKEELETFNKGKDGYVEKQMFLERADFRQFEKEKSSKRENKENTQSIDSIAIYIFLLLNSSNKKRLIPSALYLFN